MNNLKEKLKLVPEQPGIYLMKDHQNGILYVGKAKNLKNRVRTYFHHNAQQSKKVQRLVWNIADFEWWTVDTELDALLLECQLIQQHHPLYNHQMNRHLNYAYVALTPTGAELTQNATGKAVVGPFRQYKRLPELLIYSQDTYLLPGTNHLTELAVKRQLPEMAVWPLTERVEQIHRFFTGQKNDLITQLELRMKAAASQLNFEHAGQLQEIQDLAQYFSSYLKQRQAFCQQDRLVYTRSLADGRQKKCYFISHGQLLERRIVPVDEMVTFDLKPLREPPLLEKTDVDPLDILMSYISQNP